MNTEPQVCCAKCFEYIARKSTNAAKLWMDLCDIQMNSYSPFGVFIENEPTLRALENMGFVVTTDTPYITYVQVQGRGYDDEGVYFCTRDEHEQ